MHEDFIMPVLVNWSGTGVGLQKAYNARGPYYA